MSTFLAVCLYVFAGCAVLGMVPAILLTAGAGQRKTATGVVLVAAFVVAVLVVAAGDLR